MSSRYSCAGVVTLAGVIALCVIRGAAPVRGQAAPAEVSGPHTARHAFPVHPWVPRHRHGVIAEPLTGAPDAAVAEPGTLTNTRLRALGLRGGRRTQIPPSSWPPEPATPITVDASRFQSALSCLCPKATPDAIVGRIGTAALAAARRYDVDPFLLAALSFHQSRCQPATRDSYGVGLTRINVAMHGLHVRGGAYHYGHPRADGSFAHASVPLSAQPLSLRALLEPEGNLAFTAALLRVFTEQCPAIDPHFQSAPHRHPVSHVIFGDGVRSALPEAMLLTVRRRLLGYYDAQSSSMCMDCERAHALQRARSRSGAPPHSDARISPWERRASFSSESRSALSSPLDGPPRIVIGVLGDERENGSRKHAGIDLLASEGEPVRAIQAGVVISAGVELRRHGLVDMPPARALEVPHSRMGARGIFVRVEHRGGVVSIYSHLADYVVEVGQHVTRGELLGTVGRTGVQTSDAHLHFGLFDQGRVLDPLVHLDRYVLSIDRGTPLE